MGNGIPKSAITEKKLKKLIKAAAKEHSSLSAWAVENDVTPQAVTAFFRGVQGAGLKIPELIGYRPQTVYLPLDEERICEMMPPREVATKRPSSKVDHTKEPINKHGRKLDERAETRERLKKRSKK